MSNTAAVALLFGGKKQLFRLTMAGLEELQDLTGVGPRHCLSRIQAGTWKIADLRETLRVGLIGGGATPTEAALIVDRHVASGRLIACEPLASAVLMAALAGSVDDEVDEGEDSAGETTGSPAGGAANSPSTE